MRYKYNKNLKVEQNGSTFIVVDNLTKTPYIVTGSLESANFYILWNLMTPEQQRKHGVA